MEVQAPHVVPTGTVGWGGGEYVLLLPDGDEDPSSYLSFSEDTWAGCWVTWDSLEDG